MPKSLYRFIGIFLSAFLGIALYSYHFQDPAFVSQSSYQLNKAGFLGAISADFLYLHFGLGALFIPIAFLAITFISKARSLNYFLSLIFITLSLSFYAQCYSSVSFIQVLALPSGAGGWLGQELISYFYFWLGQLGSQVFIHLIFFQSLNTVLNGYLFDMGSKFLLSFKFFFERKEKNIFEKHERKTSLAEMTVQQVKKRSSQEQSIWQEQADRLSSQLIKYGIENKITAIIPGPVVVRFELQLAAGERSSKVVTLAKDLARSLLISHLSVIENIPGSSSIGIEIPQKKREVIDFEPLLKELDPSYKLPLVLGVQTQSQPVIVDLVKLPHLLVAGSTGSGKSVGVASMLLSLIKQHDHFSLRLILIDPKVLEFARYENLAHLALPIINDHEKALAALIWCVDLMESRYHLMAKYRVRHIEDYRALTDKDKSLTKMPYLVIVIDELADLMMLSKKAVEEPIARLAQKARACGIHLIIATQRPSVDIITGLIKANIPARLAYAVSSKVDSRTILDKSGGESLLGMGDAYFMMPGYPNLQRVHGAYVSDMQIEKVVEQFKTDKPNYLADMKAIIDALKNEA